MIRVLYELVDTSKLLLLDPTLVLLLKLSFRLFLFDPFILSFKLFLFDPVRLSLRLFLFDPFKLSFKLFLFNRLPWKTKNFQFNKTKTNQFLSNSSYQSKFFIENFLLNIWSSEENKKNVLEGSVCFPYGLKIEGDFAGGFPVPAVPVWQCVWWRIFPRCSNFHSTLRRRCRFHSNSAAVHLR